MLWHKSYSADSTPVKWFLIGDSKRFFLFVEPRPGYFNKSSHFFGDYIPYISSDAYTCLLIGIVSSFTGTYPGDYSVYSKFHTLVSYASYNAWHYGPRSYDQLPGPVTLGKIGDQQGSNGTTLGASGPDYPGPSGLMLSVLRIGENTGNGIIRGLWPGIFQPLHLMPLATGTKVDNVTGLSGRKLLALSSYGSQTWQTDANDPGSANIGCFIDITGPWE
jgi:hypothetical protein